MPTSRRSFEFVCKDGGQAGFVEVGLFEAFPRLQRMDVQAATPQGQLKATLSAPDRARAAGALSRPPRDRAPRAALPLARAPAATAGHRRASTSPPASAVFLHGPSGCGKSTLLGLLAGVLLARAGPVSVLGQDWAALSARAARRGARRPRGLHLPAVQPAALPERARQRAAALPLLGAARAARAGGRRGAAGAAAARGPAAGAVGAAGRRAFGGPAAARGGGARADRHARTRDRRRAHLGAGRGAARRLHGAAAGRSARQRQHAGLRQPRRAAGRALRPPAVAAATEPGARA